MKTEVNSIAVLHLTTSIGPKSGGLGPIAVGLAAEQQALGHSAAIWTADMHPTATTDEAAMPPISNAKNFPLTGPKQLGYSLGMEQAASTSGSVYDVAHQHGIWTGVSRATNRWRSTFLRPTIVAPQGTLEEYTLKISRWKKRIALLGYESANLRGASCLQATSAGEATSFRNFGLTNPIAVIPNGVSEDWLHSQGSAARFRSRFSIPGDPHILLFLSRVHPKKGIELLIEAAAQLRSELQDWVIVIAGYEDFPGYQQQLEQLAAKLQITDRILFVGGLFAQDKTDAFAAADLFVLPTYSDNFAIVVAEALSAGIPVITTRGTPWEELATHQCGWWIDVTVESIRDALQSAVAMSDGERVEMGKRGRQLVENKYVWNQIAQQTLDLYAWLLKRAPKPDFVITD